MTNADREKLAEARRQIERRTSGMIERTIANAEAFRTSPAHAAAIREIIERGRKIL